MAEPLKLMFSDAFVNKLKSKLKSAHKNFNSDLFLDKIYSAQFDQLELKERMHTVTTAMHAGLPMEYTNQLAALKKVAPEISGFTGVIFPHFVQLYGLHDEKNSLQALEFFTPYSTSEFAIRPFLIQNPNVIEKMYDWSKHSNFHVRRLASEGCRPLLPWAMKLDQYVKDPKPILSILDNLKADSHDYVYRSVANNLNDISKNHPDLVLSIANKWKGKHATTDKVIKHALRTLLKKSNPEALNLFGFKDELKMKVNEFKIQHPSIKIGNNTNLIIDFVNNHNDCEMRIEYLVSYIKANGSTSDKVFQISERILKRSERFKTTKKIDFKDLTTRKHYPGNHKVKLRINGKILAETSVQLK